MMLKLQYFVFFYSASELNKKQGVNFMLGSWKGVKGRKRLRTPAIVV